MTENYDVIITVHPKCTLILNKSVNLLLKGEKKPPSWLLPNPSSQNQSNLDPNGNPINTTIVSYFLKDTFFSFIDRDKLT